MKVITCDGKTLVLESKPLGSGGAGDVYRITSPQSMMGSCVKIYQEKYRTKKELCNKINYQAKNPPTDIKSSDFVLCWPTNSVFDQQKNFLGFVMPLAFGDSVSLKVISTGKMPNSTPDDIKMQYSRSSLDGGLNRLKICINLAHAMYKLHMAGYVVIDLKPENFMVTKTGEISVLDLDNVQVSDNQTGQLLYNAELATIDYQPVEGLTGKADPRKMQIDANWDYFSLAVMLYQILYGIHPYRATFKPPYADIQSEHKAIENGLYVFGSKSQFIEGKNKAHDKLLRTPKIIQVLFMRAFDMGNHNPKQRPNAQEFGKALFEVYSFLKKNMVQGSNHFAGSKNTQSTPSLPPKLKAKLGANGATTNNKPSFHQTIKPNASKKTNSWFSSVFFWLLCWVFAYLLVSCYALLADNGSKNTGFEPDYIVDDEYAYTATEAAADAAVSAQAYTPYEYEYNIESVDYAIDRTIYAPNGEPYPDGAGHVPGYPKLSLDGRSIVTILNDENYFIIFGKLVRLYPDDEVAVRHFYIPPYGGLNLRDLDPGTYEVRYENVNEHTFTKTQRFELDDGYYYDDNSYSHINIKVNDGGNIGEDDF